MYFYEEIGEGNPLFLLHGNTVDFICEILLDERTHSKTQKSSRNFWQACHGSDWENIIDNDTNASIKQILKNN